MICVKYFAYNFELIKTKKSRRNSSTIIPKWQHKIPSASQIFELELIGEEAYILGKGRYVRLEDRNG